MNTVDPPIPNFESFAAAARAEGFDEVLERNWEPHTVIASHTHSFAVKAVLVAGEMWLTVGERVQHLLPGDRFELAKDVPHDERYGEEGAVYWVARRS